jgi:hypothetical protein
LDGLYNLLGAAGFGARDPVLLGDGAGRARLLDRVGQRQRFRGRGVGAVLLPGRGDGQQDRHQQGRQPGGDEDGQAGELDATRPRGAPLWRHLNHGGHQM